jgi:Cu/Ag efflux pump CusA
VSSISAIDKETGGPAQIEHWTGRHLKPIVFAILVLAALGVYLAAQIPVAVFPSTNFPRIVIGVDAGVMPIDQMEVAVTRPIEVQSTPFQASIIFCPQRAVVRLKSISTSLGVSICFRHSST